MTRAGQNFVLLLLVMLAARAVHLSLCPRLFPSLGLDARGPQRLETAWGPQLAASGAVAERLAAARASASVRLRCAALDRWLGEAAAQVPREDECRIADSAELYQVKARFQALKERCDAQTDEFRAINEAGESLRPLFDRTLPHAAK